MSLFRLGLQRLGNVSRCGLQKVIPLRSFSKFSILFQKENALEEVEPPSEKQSNVKTNLYDQSDRSKEIPVEVSIKYLESDAYKTTYGEDPVWIQYRRNFKGQYMPAKTRKTCIRNNVISTGNPCPICRDEYLVLDYRNVKLIQQFISSINGETIGYKKTGLCQRQHRNLLVAIYKAKNYGTISYDVPFIRYNYDEWYNPKLITEVQDFEQYQETQHEHVQCQDTQHEHEQCHDTQQEHEKCENKHHEHEQSKDMRHENDQFEDKQDKHDQCIDKEKEH